MMIGTHRRRLALTVTQQRVCSLLILGTMAFCSLTAASSADSPPKPKLTAIQQERLKERDPLLKESLDLRQLGKYAEAIEAASKIEAIERDIFGQEHDEVLGTRDFIAHLQEQRGEFAAARKIREEILAIRRKVAGADHWRTGDARRALENIEVLEKLSPEDRKLLNQAWVLSETVKQLHQRGKARDALEMANQALDIRRKVLGTNHLNYVSSLNNLAELYSAMDDWAKSEPYCLEAGEIEKRLLGERHPDYVQKLEFLTVIYLKREDLVQAEPFLRQVVDIKKATLGENHPAYVASRDSLEALRKTIPEQAKLKQREEFSQQMMELRKQGKLTEALAAAGKMLAVEQQLSGDKHDQGLATRIVIAELHEERGDLASAPKVGERRPTSIVRESEAVGGIRRTRPRTTAGRAR